MKLFMIARDIEVPIRLEDARKVSGIDSDIKFNLYSQSGKLIVGNVSFKEIEEYY